MKRALLPALLCVALAALSLNLGRYPLSLGEIISGEASPTAQVLFWQMRLPRTILVMLCGAALALTGLVYQTLFRNPLVSPDVLGVTSGCSLGAAAAMVLFSAGGVLAQSAAFLGGMAAVVFALLLARLVRQDVVLGLVMAGIIVSALSSSLIMLLKYVADPRQLAGIEFWLMGGFSSGGWAEIYSVLWIFLPAVLLLYAWRWPLNVLALGEEAAFTLGVAVRAMRLAGILAATFLVAAVVAAAGLVSWIGLIAPHVVKLAYGEDLRRNFVPALWVGAALLLAADLAARSLSSAEIPISIVTTLIGGPFLAYLLWRKGGTL